MEEWYCEIAGRELGPLSSHQLKAMAVEGQIQPTDRVRRGPTGQWASASRVRGLFAPTPEPSPQPSAPPPLPQAPTPTPSSPAAAPAETSSPSAVETPAPPAAPEPPSFFASTGAAMPSIAEVPAPQPTAAAGPPIPPSAPPPLPPGSDFVEAAEHENVFAPQDDTEEDEAMPAEIFTEPPDAVPSPQMRNLSLLVHARRKRQQQMLMAGALLFVLMGLVVTGVFLATADVKGIAEVKPSGGLSGLAKKLDQTAAVKPTGDEVKPESSPKTEQVKQSEPPAPVKPEEPKPSKEDPASATTLRMVVGDVPVRIVSLVRDTNETSGPRLVITVEVKNPDAKEKLAFAPWNREDGAPGVTLTDDQGKTYSAKPIDAASILGKPTAFSIEPSETACDVLAFELPNAKAEFLQLDLPGAAFGKEATAGFKIPAKLIVAQQIVAKAPPGAFAPKKKAAKSRPKAKPGTPEADFGLDDYESPVK